MPTIEETKALAEAQERANAATEKAKTLEKDLAEEKKKGTKATEDSTKATDSAKKSQTDYNSILSAAKDKFTAFTTVLASNAEAAKLFSQSIASAASSQSNHNEINENSAKALSLIYGQTIGAANAFKALDSHFVSSTTGAGNFAATITKVVGTFKGMSDGVSKITSLASGMLGHGAVASAMEVAKKTGVELTDVLVGQMTTFAKNVERGEAMKNAYLKLAAASGSLGDTYRRSGQGLTDLNKVVDEHRNYIKSAADSVNVSSDVMQKYYVEMGRLPGVYKQNIDLTSVGGKQLSFLSAAASVATATQRDFKEVVGDVTTAMYKYGASSKEALVFTSRISEISNNLGIELGIVEGVMSGVADQFKLIGNQAESSSKLVNNLFQSFQAGGVTASNAADMIKHITGQISNLSIAQKSFLSAQTGGAGGLMGGFQVDLMMRQGKLDEVFNKFKQQMTRQLGPIVSLDEAAASPEAASRLTRQRAMLQSGPLGSFAKTGDEAQRILDAFRTGAKVQTKELEKSPEQLLNNNMNVSHDLQKQGNTSLDQMARSLENLEEIAAMQALDTYKKNFSGAASGSNISAEVAARFQSFSDRSKIQDAESTTRFGGKTQSHLSQDVSKGVGQLGSSMRSSGNLVYGVGKELFNMVSSGAEEQLEVNKQKAAEQEAARKRVGSMNKVNTTTYKATLPKTDTLQAAIESGSMAPPAVGKQLRATAERSVAATTKATIQPPSAMVAANQTQFQHNHTMRITIDANGVTQVDHMAETQQAAHTNRPSLKK